LCIQSSGDSRRRVDFAKPPPRLGDRPPACYGSAVTLSMLPGGCTCQGQEPRCQACIEQTLFWLGGVATVRGENWARRVAAAAGVDRPWPDYEACAELARKQVAGLAAPGTINEALAQRCHAGAAREWARIRGR
jgi:hypothetical protein